jgi:ubiquinone/menaquinone biosynthesis C-methylase UbiE
VTSASADAATYFGGMSESYDALIRRAVPRYDEMMSTLVDHLPTRAERILELGSGTGNLSVALARRFPMAALTFVDASDEMISMTSDRLRDVNAAFGGRATPLPIRFEEVAIIEERFDLVVSSISMHHVIDKKTLYADVFHLLTGGGAFHWSDQTCGATDLIHARLWAEWLGFCRQPGNCSEEEIAGLVEHAAAHDHYVPLPRHIALLGEAGFTGIDCVWRNNMWVIMTGARP